MLLQINIVKVLTFVKKIRVLYFDRIYQKDKIEEITLLLTSPQTNWAS